MKAAFLTREGFKVREVPEPVLKGDGVILKVEACGVCGSDLRAWRDRENIPEEIIRGHEIAGTVVEAKGEIPYGVGTRLAVAADINCLKCFYCKKGEYNLCDNKKILGRDIPGGFAQYMLLDEYMIEHGIVNEMPEGMKFVEGAFAEPLSSVVALHRRFPMNSDRTVVVLGSGPMGCLHADLSKLSGAKVVLADISQERLEAAKEVLKNSVIYVNNSREDLIRIVKDVTKGIGADLVIVAAPSPSAQSQALHLSRKRGIIVFFGGLPPDRPEVSLNANLIHYNELIVTGSFSYNPSDHRHALELLAQKKIDASRYIKEFPLEDIESVVEELSEGKNIDYLKAVIRPWR